MKKITCFIALLSLFISNAMAMDTPMEEESLPSRKRPFSALEEAGDVTPAPAPKRARVNISSPQFPIDLWHLIFKTDQQKCHKLLSVCSQFNTRFWSSRTNVRLCKGGSDETVKFIQSFCPNLTTLELSYKFPKHIPKDQEPKNFPEIPSFSLTSLTNLQTLILNTDGTFNLEVIPMLTQIKCLDWSLENYSYSFTDMEDSYESIKERMTCLTNLRELRLGKPPFFNHDISKLSFLKRLDFGPLNTITNNGIKDMVNLTSLSLGYNHIVTHMGLTLLTNLTELTLEKYNKVNIAYLTSLTQLKTLTIDPSYEIHKDNFTEIVQVYKEKLPNLEVRYDVSREQCIIS